MSEQSELPTNQNQGHSPDRGRTGGIAWPMIIIFIGVVLLLNTLGTLSWHVWGKLWPFILPTVLIVIGLDLLVGRQSNLLRLALAGIVLILLVAAAIFLVTTDKPEAVQPVDESWSLGEIDQGEVTLKLALGEMNINPLEDSRDFAQVHIEAPEDVHFERTFELRGSTAHLELSGPEKYSSWGLPFGDNNEILWDVRLSDQVPLEMAVETGVGVSELDLGELQVERLTLHAGVGEVTVTLPERVERGQVDIQAGIGQITLIIPEGVAAEIRANTGLGGTSVDTDRFPERGAGVYRSPDYDSARYRLDIQVSGGIGEIEVR